MPTGTSAARRERAANGMTSRGERTRLSLLEAGKTVFEKQGYFDARVSDIVAEAGISHGSFYTYFSSRQDLFEEIMRGIGESMAEAVSHRPEDEPGNTFVNLENANRRYLEVHRKHMKMMVLYEQLASMDDAIHALRVEARRRHIGRVSTTISRLQQRGDADPSIDAESTAAALVSMLSSFAYWAWELGYDLEQTVTTVSMIWARGIGMPVSSAS